MVVDKCLVWCIFHTGELCIHAQWTQRGLVGCRLRFDRCLGGVHSNQTLSKRNTEPGSIILAIFGVLATSWLPLVDSASHVGGLFGGACMSCVLFAGRMESRAFIWGVRSIGTVLFCMAFSVACYILASKTEPMEALLHI